ncbi:MAG: putative PEP-binding protein [Microcoleaceae cyanobacterium]
MDDLYWLHQIQAANRADVGETAYSLSCLLHYRQPVLPGIVLTAKPFWSFLESIDWLEPLLVDFPESSLYVDVDNSLQLQSIAYRIRQQILATPLPEDLLSQLRATLRVFETDALQFDLDLSPHQLDVLGLFELPACWTKIDAMASALKQIWAELFRARSLFYWQRCKVQIHQLQPHILIQPLFPTIASGSLRTEPKLWTIQATRGLGYSLYQTSAQVEQFQITPPIHPEPSEPPQHQGSHYQGSSPVTDHRDISRLQTIAYQLKLIPADCSDPVPVAAQLDRSPQTEDINSIPGQYRPPDAESPIQVTLLPEAQVSVPILSHESIDILIQLTQTILTKMPGQWRLDWTFCTSTNGTNQFYFKRFLPFSLPVAPTDIVPKFTPDSEQHSIWRGVAASAGIVLAPACVINGTNAEGTLPNSTFEIEDAIITDLPKETSVAHQVSFVPGTVLVIPELTMEWIPLLKFASGLVTERGGITGHGAILARELGIPAVLGVQGITQQLTSGIEIWVNGNQGEVYLNSALNSPEDFSTHPLEDSSEIPRNMPVNSPKGHTFESPIATRLMVNLSQSSSVQRLQNLPIDGVGILRSEFIALEILFLEDTPATAKGKPPPSPKLRPQSWDFRQWLQPEHHTQFIERMVQGLQQITTPLKSKPLFYRALDLREFHQITRPFWSAEATEPQPELQVLSQNPLLNPQRVVTLFDLELAVLSRLHQLGETNIHLVLPFVRSVEEFSAYARRIDPTGLNSNPRFQVWLMAEVPSVLFLLPDYVKAGLQGIAIGTNDLTQFLLGIDRNQSPVAYLNEQHPACLRFLQQLIETARDLNITCSICGDAPVLYPELIDYLVQWGITSISVNPDSFSKTYAAIARAEHRQLLRDSIG